MNTNFFIPTDRGVKAIPLCNIVRIEAISNYSRLFFSNDKPLTVAKVLHWFEDKLPSDDFRRIHRTHIINRFFVSEISCGNKITLLNGEQLRVSRRKKKKVGKMMEVV